MSASQGIRALVSGFAEPLRSQRLLLMFQVFIDDSGKGAKKTFVLAGYMSPADNWARFSDEWKEILDQRSSHYRPLEYFKMSEMKSEADVERCGWFYRVIARHTRMGISVAVDEEALLRVIDEINWPHPLLQGYQGLRNPYFLAFRVFVHQLASFLKDALYLQSPIDFIFDQNVEKIRIFRGWEFLQKSVQGRYGDLLANPPIFRDDKEVLPLQAADLLAWWIRKWQLEGNIEAISKQDFPWPNAGELRSPHRHWYCDETYIREEMNSMRQHLDVATNEPSDRP